MRKLATLLLLPIGCLGAPSLPPPMSAARFVRFKSPASASGKVSFGVGEVVGIDGQDAPNQDSSHAVATMPYSSEGNVSLWLAKRYDLSLVGTYARLNAEGNLILVNGDRFRLGLIHGGGIGWQTCSDNCDVTWYLQASAGLFAQLDVGPRRALFASLKYSYASDTGQGDLPTHYGIASIGYAIGFKRLSLSPELIGSYVTWRDTKAAWESEWLIVPSLTVAADF